MLLRRVRAGLKVLLERIGWSEVGQESGWREERVGQVLHHTVGQG